ncbi:CoA transferase [Roseomonas sp. CCTCC AB2023176]|uniref:CoA transferase n=1 Tax=Roseomonas sp. CCTCC AB2023176 TaxID=3342640 RepID=UPI0035DA986D
MANDQDSAARDPLRHDLPRRDLAKLLAGGALLAGTAGSVAAQPPANADFDIDAAFRTFMRDLGVNAEDAGGRVTFTGRDPLVRSRFRTGACMAIPAMGAGVNAAAIWRERTGQSQDLSVDLRQAVYSVAPWARLLVEELRAVNMLPGDPLPPAWSWQPTMNGRPLQAPLAIGNPLSFAVFEAKDGRCVTPTGLYPQHFVGFLRVIGASPDPESIAARIRAFDSADLEQRVGEAGMIMGVHRTAEEWAVHPQGRAVAVTPLVEIVKIGDGPIVPWTPNPTQPLSGIRAVACAHVIASSTVARNLAGQGAEVLHIARAQGFEHDAIYQDVNIGMRSSFVNLKIPEGRQQLQALLPRTDVFIEGFRGRKMGELGFGPEEVARAKPGVIYCSVRGYGWSGPWNMYAGFDMEALTVSGFTAIEGGGPDRPRFPPTFVMNDYIAGYLGTAGVLAALRRRAKEGGSYHVRINLTRCAMWFMSLGQVPAEELANPGPESRLGPPETVRAASAYGQYERLAPLVKLSRTPTRFREPLLDVRGGSHPVWEG